MGTKRSTTGGQHSFATIPGPEIQRSRFNRSSGLKTAFDAGWLIPIWCDEALPGDTFNMKMTHFARLATPLHPIMDNLYLDTFFFSVPIRLVWDNWQKFNGEQVDPGDSTDFLVPTITTSASVGAAEESLSDYLGIPPGVKALQHSALWHRAYNLIWTEWFRDENLQDSAFKKTDDGPDAEVNYPLRRRGKRHDYMTSCLPWPQKSDPVTIPIGTSAPVISTGVPSTWYDGTSTPGTLIYDNAVFPTVGISTAQTPLAALRMLNPQLTADLSSATATTINQLREAFQVQRLYERDARGGTRYSEILRAHFGVVSPDQRLQRPEYLGGSSTPISITPVPQTSESGTSAQGNLAGFGVTSGTSHGFTTSFVEHCVLIGLACLRADLNYQQGLERMWSRRDRWDFYWPSLAHLGEQAVLNKEIYAQGSDGGTQDDEVFGYQERYAEYRYKPSLCTGKMRSSSATSLDVWHLAQDFSSLPALGDAFIQEDPPVDRVIAVATEPHLIFDAYFDLQCARPMPVFGVPGMIDHF